MTFSEYRQHDARSLAHLVQTKAVPPQELLDAAIQRAEAVNPKINAIVHKMYEEARSMGAQVPANAPFAGVPFLIKDLGVAVKGQPMSYGTRMMKSFIPQEDNYLAQRLRRAGFLFLAKTNVPEYGLTPFTESKLWGPARNPWNLEHTPGGSSGGSAAAVGAGITPIATASDGGGSIRIPASCCGLFGLKPSRGRISLGPTAGEMWGGAVVEGCVSRTVRDSAAYLDAVQGGAPGELFVIQPPERPYVEELQQLPKQLRIGYSTAHLMGRPMHDDCIQAVEHAVKLLQSLGHEVVEAELPFTRADLAETFLMMVCGQMSADIRLLGERIGRKITVKDVELNTWALHMLAQTYTAGEYAYQKNRWNDIARRAATFHESYDLMLTPTLAAPPPKIGALHNTPGEDRLIHLLRLIGAGSLLKANIDRFADKVFEFIPHTPLANMTGQPAMSVPLYNNAGGLPIGVMFTAPIGEEGLLFRLAGQLEQAQPWKDVVPH